MKVISIILLSVCSGALETKTSKMKRWDLFRKDGKKESIMMAESSTLIIVSWHFPSGGTRTADA